MSGREAVPRICETRRNWLSRAGLGFGQVGLTALLAENGLLQSGEFRRQATASPLSVRPGHLTPRVKSIIWLFMNGGPSHIDTWDYKPQLAKHDGEELQGFDKETGFFPKSIGPLMRSPFSFAQHGESGTWVSEIFPHLSQQVDHCAFLHGCWTDSNNHAPALLKMNSGFTRQGFPCFGSWVTYGLGSEQQNLPAFVVMTDLSGRGVPKGYAQNWTSGFLPNVYQGTALKAQGPAIGFLQAAQDVTPGRQRRQLDLLAKLNAEHGERLVEDAGLAARMESFELAYRMQLEAPAVLDLSVESKATQQLYGVDEPHCGSFARQCLLARRMVEQGVRCVQIYSGGMDNERSWDGHKDIAVNHRGFALETDQPVAALLADLEARGLLDSTLVVWGGEFGRLPISQKGGTGRDHNPHAFTIWLAGGGVKGGYHHGATDELGHKAISGRVSVPDIHATLLHLLGLDHERLTYPFNGRDYRLTDVSGRVIHEVLG